MELFINYVFFWSVTLLSICYCVYQWGNLDKYAEEVVVFASNIHVLFLSRQGLFINLNLFSSFNDNGFDNHYIWISESHVVLTH